ncbi:peptidase A4 family protein [Colletotrichum orchidophilum]|uniref:Peptidase A4 family protein n=1 Tax=Colletotrichum orchidophilum TaxID=1209926 RepID=A0A1G4BS38_9PEZI|nr:peptidase A4 family protein [Colletotrichum orchidophilum]OHF04125.1 peptidase A4 family protein [Colletotrichum orchidophilum]
MKFAAFVLAAAGIVAAAPGTKLIQRDYSPLTPRASRSRYNSAPLKRLSTEAVENLEKTHGIRNVEYSSNWGGAVKIGNGYNHVTGTITVPEASGFDGAAASAWVGIDGDTCQTAILQTGISVYADGTFDAWYEWIPDYSYSFSGFSVHVGDQIKMTVDASSKTKGVATLQNLSTGKTVTHTFTNTPSSLCETNAEWIVEAFEEDGSQVTLADFGTVTFTNAVASGSSGSTTPAGADILDISPDNGRSIQAAASVSGSTVTVKYVG